MNQPRRSFPATSHFYLWIALLAWCGLPFWAPAIAVLQGSGEVSAIYVGALGCFAIAAAMKLVSDKCSSESLSFMDGLLCITCFMQTGWTYTSLLVVLFAVPAALAAAIWIVVHGLAVRADAESYQQSFHGLVRFFQRNRMIQ